MTTFLALLAFASPVVAQYCPVAVGPGCDRIWLVENGAPPQGEDQDPTLPTHFRHLPEVGLRSLGESGSAQPTANGYRQIASWLRKTYPQVSTVAVFDLRQESHGYVAGTPLSWYYGRDQVNCGKSELGMAQDEGERLAAFSKQTVVHLFGRTTPRQTLRARRVLPRARSRPALFSRKPRLWKRLDLPGAIIACTSPISTRPAFNTPTKKPTVSSLGAWKSAMRRR